MCKGIFWQGWIIANNKFSWHGLNGYRLWKDQFQDLHVFSSFRGWVFLLTFLSSFLLNTHNCNASIRFYSITTENLPKYWRAKFKRRESLREWERASRNSLKHIIDSRYNLSTKNNCYGILTIFRSKYNRKDWRFTVLEFLISRL